MSVGRAPRDGAEERGPVAPALSLNEWVVLALLSEEPAHGFAVSKQLRPESDLGRILTVHRPLVYRALDRVVGAGLAEAHQTEPGDAGPNRTSYRVTDAGREALDGWMRRPVGHVRDLRIEFLVKLRLTERAGRDPAALVAAQRAALDDTLDGLADPGPDADVVDRWRHHNALAARRFLDDLGGVPGPGSDPTG
ncbi:MAG: PadR family transcriptional regulator [Actinomycetota bacterium]|nr:PadR family transcriptional regulator [Actinomycetota bacterium]